MSDDTGAPPPPRPDPWATTAPREALRDNNAARIVSMTPGMTQGPGGAYPANMVDFCGHDENYVQDVRFTGQEAMVLRSKTQHVHNGGSGGVCEPIGHAPRSAPAAPPSSATVTRSGWTTARPWARRRSCATRPATRRRRTRTRSRDRRRRCQDRQRPRRLTPPLRQLLLGGSAMQARTRRHQTSTVDRSPKCRLATVRGWQVQHPPRSRAVWTCQPPQVVGIRPRAYSKPNFRQRSSFGPRRSTSLRNSCLRCCVRCPRSRQYCRCLRLCQRRRLLQTRYRHLNQRLAPDPETPGSLLTVARS